ncbi:hypothetical protein RGUI_3998 [Rhodovulum sp. P5]|nr:hypothetical protein RGUI_3998 [Rhodovulum sp. P5]
MDKANSHGSTPRDLRANMTHCLSSQLDTCQIGVRNVGRPLVAFSAVPNSPLFREVFTVARAYPRATLADGQGRAIP